MKVCKIKKCRHAGKPQPEENFYRNIGFPDNLNPECKDCVKDRKSKHAEKTKQDRKQFYETFIGYTI